MKKFFGVIELRTIGRTVLRVCGFDTASALAEWFAANPVSVREIERYEVSEEEGRSLIRAGVDVPSGLCV